ncbi:MAG TPA: hypothetical protein VMT02_00985 [Burkholderiales bacterium]|nr:hypothetical protein [Burkholderiales bacterium]
MPRAVPRSGALRWLAAALALGAAMPAAAQEPEAAYAGYHRAALAGDLADMMRFSDDARRAEVAGMTDAQRAAEAKMAGAAMPRAYTVRGRILAPDGKSARVFVQGPGGAPAGGKPETLYGTARMVRQGDEWRVSAIEWSNVDPGIPAQAPPASAAAKPAAPKRGETAAPARGAPVVGSINSEPVRKFGQQKPPCVYKPVMTQEDIDNCR